MVTTRYCHGVEHTQASVKALLPRLHYFKEGTCIVHHMFGGEVTELVSKAYGDAFLTAHFEVCCTASPHCSEATLQWSDGFGVAGSVLSMSAD